MGVRKTYQEQMVDIAEEFYLEHGNDPTTSRDIAVWAITTGRWEQKPEQTIKVCQRDLSAALRNEVHTDPQGRSVRSFLSLRTLRADDEGKEVQKHLWFDVRKGTVNQVRVAFLQRRSQVLNDVQSLKRDIDSYNDNYLPHGEKPIQLSFDFDSDDDTDELVA